MRNMLTACFVGVAIWFGMAFNVEAPKPKADFYRPAGAVITKAVQEINCGEQAHACRARKRMEKVRAQNP